MNKIRTRVGQVVEELCFFSKSSLPLRVIRSRLIPGILKIKHKMPCFPSEHCISRNSSKARLPLCVVAQVTRELACINTDPSPAPGVDLINPTSPGHHHH